MKDLTVVNEKVVMTSRQIAEELGKEHSKVVSKIQEVLDVAEYDEINRTDNQGRTYKEYLLDKDAFILLVMNYQGYNDFKRNYINQFNKMEEHIRKELQPKQLSMEELLQMQLTSIQKEKSMKIAITQKQEIIETVLPDNSLFSMNTACKEIGLHTDKGKPMGRNKFFQLLRNDGFLTQGNGRQERNLPKQRYIEQGLFEVNQDYIEQLDTHKPTTYMTAKGIQYFISKYKHLQIKTK